jgi:hypothetical protein
MSSSTIDGPSTPVGQKACRLFVILARESKTAVVFRRGPSRWVQLLRWYTATDAFEPGQWFRGRIYEKRSDLSPNGELLIYFAAKFERATKDSFYSWTAISRPPYLTALVLWPGVGAWDGGGLFESDSCVWVNQNEWKEELNASKPQRLEIRFAASRGEDYPVFMPRLLRDGWEQRAELGVNNRVVKPAPNDRFTLAMHWRGSDFDHPLRYYLRDWDTDKERSLDGIGWADFDHEGHLVFARGGKLFRARYAGKGKLEEDLVADFIRLPA